MRVNTRFLSAALHVVSGVILPGPYIRRSRDNGLTKHSSIPRSSAYIRQAHRFRRCRLACMMQSYFTLRIQRSLRTLSHSFTYPARHGAWVVGPLRDQQFRRPRTQNGVRALATTTHGRRPWPLLAGVVASGAVATVLFSFFARAHADARSSSEPSKDEGKHIRLRQVQEHGRNAERRWVIHGHRVYDIEDWIPNHPGGEVILRAAGGAIDPYWEIFSIHQKQDVYDILEQYFIGILDPQDLVDGKLPQDHIDDPFKSDPKRDPALIVHSEKPFNAETPLDDLDKFITPTEKHYVRHHLWVPDLKEKSFRLTIEMADGEEKTYSVEELRNKFHQRTITATLQCSGNRRADMSRNARPASGLQWGPGAISNAEWTGVRLRDVLQDAGLALNDPPEEVRHVQFLGSEAYGSSIPIEKALDAYGDVLLVYQMNGKLLTPDHGYPLRVLVPGYVAARSVKWISKIVLSEDESSSQWQQRDYKCFGPNQGGKDVDWTSAPAIQETPVQSVITKVQELSRHSGASSRKLLQVYGLEEDSVLLEGYAFSGGGRKIVRVDISTDGGHTWKQASLENQERQKGAKAWSWTNWRFVAPKRDVGRSCIVKAVDEANNTQPETFDPHYNFRGNLTNAWHRVMYGGGAQRKDGAKGKGEATDSH